MRTMPNVKMLLRTRTAIAGRMCDLASTVEDFDRDGASMAFLVGGEDTRPFDPTVPPPLPGSRWESEEPALRPAPEADSTRDPVVAGDRPNILLLTIDACRWDLVPGARTEAPWLREFSAHTPALDSLLRVSARFDGAYTPSAGTEDTFLSLFSGLDLPAILEGSVERRLLPRRLAHAGYATAGYSNDPHFPGSAWGWPKMQLGPESEGPELARRLARFVASQPPGRRAFAWYHVMDLHAQVLDPFSIHSYSVSSHIRGYATGLERVDATIDALCSELRRLGAAERTLILLAADHGEEFGGHGHFHHNISVYEPAIRVVCWATGPGVAPGFRPYAVDLQDVYPTVLEAAGADSIACVGRSLWPALRDTNARLESRTHYSFLPRRGFSRRFNSAQRFERGQAAIVDGVARRKVLIRFGDECEEIYDLSADPLERRNLAGSRPAWADTLERELMRRVMSRPPRSFTGS
jgi:arylsulfatase A-like enzyme